MEILESVLNFLVTIFVLSNVSLFILSLFFLNWSQVREQGLVIDLMLFGGYRKDKGSSFVVERGKKIMHWLDLLRHWSLIVSISIFIAGWCLKLFYV